MRGRYSWENPKALGCQGLTNELPAAWTEHPGSITAVSELRPVSDGVSASSDMTGATQQVEGPLSKPSGSARLHFAVYPLSLSPHLDTHLDTFRNEMCTVFAMRFVRHRLKAYPLLRPHGDALRRLRLELRRCYESIASSCGPKKRSLGPSFKPISEKLGQAPPERPYQPSSTVQDLRKGSAAREPAVSRT